MKEARFVEVETETCPWCGHEKCPKCQAHRWPALRDGCCQCRAKITEILDGTKKGVPVFI